MDARVLDRPDLAEFVEHPTTSRVKKRKGRFGNCVSINLSRAKVAREKKPAVESAKPKSAPAITAPPSPLGRFLVSYADIVEACRVMADRLNISREEIDRLAGLPCGHSGHVLSRTYSKPLGPAHVMPMLEVLGLRLLVVEDASLVERTIIRRKLRKADCVRQPRQSAPHGRLDLEVKQPPYPSRQ